MGVCVYVACVCMCTLYMIYELLPNVVFVAIFCKNNVYESLLHHFLEVKFDNIDMKGTNIAYTINKSIALFFFFMYNRILILVVKNLCERPIIGQTSTCCNHELVQLAQCPHPTRKKRKERKRKNPWNITYEDYLILSSSPNVFLRKQIIMEVS